MNSLMTPSWVRKVLILIVAVVLFSIEGLTAGAESKDADLLKETWQAYKHRYIQQDGRVKDPGAQDVSTSESQSYAMLRAVWMDDRATFDRTYQWSINNLQVRGDKLFAWRWGKQQNGNWGPLDRTAASDADEDIALALLMAHQRWQVEQYRTDALALLNDLWEKETVQTPLGPVLLPGDWDWSKIPVKNDEGKRHQRLRKRRINPSYFAPYAYRVFAQADPRHPWMQLVDSSYEILRRSTYQSFTRLPSDWIELDLVSSTLTPYDDPRDTRGDFGYEAFRTFWRIGLDKLLNPTEQRAWAFLKNGTVLRDYWVIHNTLPGPLSLSGVQRGRLTSLSIYGGVLPALQSSDPAIAEAVYQKIFLSNLKSGIWQPSKDYYAQNWLWFGVLTHHASIKPTSKSSKQSVLTRILLLHQD
ncbi:MAG: hypothetical protein KTR14_10520 [Vampirovibrio sp.]|nr:hypothetical protein [Vampirovibrio sp.]